MPYRTNIVVTRQPDWSADGVLVAHSVEEGIAKARELDGDVMVIGGGHIYRDAMPLADAQILTEVHQSPEGDTRYPEFDRTKWREVRREMHDGYDLSGGSALPADRSLFLRSAPSDPSCPGAARRSSKDPGLNLRASSPHLRVRPRCLLRLLGVTVAASSPSIDRNEGTR